MSRAVHLAAMLFQHGLESIRRTDAAGASRAYEEALSLLHEVGAEEELEKKRWELADAFIDEQA